MSHTIDEDNSLFTADLRYSGPLTYSPSLIIIDEEDEMVKEYRKHDIPDGFPVSLIHNLLDVTTEDIKQFIVIYALKQMIVFQDFAIESDNGTLEDSDECEWEIFEDSDGLDSDDEESSDSCFESDEDSREIVEENANRFEIRTKSNLPNWERIETRENKIVIEQGKNLVATYADKLAEDVDPLWFLLVFPDCFPNGQETACEKSTG